MNKTVNTFAVFWVMTYCSMSDCRFVGICYFYLQSTLKRVVMCSSEILTPTDQIIRRCKQEDPNKKFDRSEHFKCNVISELISR